MLKKGGVVWTIWNCVVAVLFITLGIVTIVLSGNKDFQNVAILIAGILAIVDASLRLLTHVLGFVQTSGPNVVVHANYGGIVGAVAELSVGILLIMVSRGESTLLMTLIQYLALFIGIILIVLGALTAIFAIVYLAKKLGYTLRGVMGIIIAALLITGGVLILVYANQEGMLQFMFVMYGIIFTVIGISLLCGTIAIAAAARRAIKAQENLKQMDDHLGTENVVEGETTEETPEEPKEEAPADEKPAEEKPADDKAE